MSEPFTESSIPYSRRPTGSKISTASSRTGPRHTTRHLIGLGSNERTQAESLSEYARRTRSRSRMLFELALRAGHRPGRVGAHQEVQVLSEHAPARARHHHPRHPAEPERFLRVHQLGLVPRRQPAQAPL